jgi:hypothetical protein
MASSLTAPLHARAWLGEADLSFDPWNFVYQIFQYAGQEILQSFSDELTQKEYVYDGIARFAAVTALNSLSQSMANWASSGFNGSPAFTTDLNSTLLQLSDSVAYDFVNQLRTNGSIKSPYSSRIANNVLNNYQKASGNGGYFAQNQYTLNQHCSNVEGFLSGKYLDLSCLSAAFGNTANNPISAQLFAENELSSRQASAGYQQTKEIDWGQGFMSLKNCNNSTTGDPVQGDSSTDSSTVNLAQTDPTYGCTIETPGSIIGHAIAKYDVDTGADLQTNADELSEVIGNLFTDLLTKTITGNGGLANASKYKPTQQPAPSGATINALLTSFASKRQGLGQFLASWQDLGSMASKAQAKLQTCQGSAAELALHNEVEPALDQASKAQQRVDDTNKKLDEFEARVRNAQAGKEDFNTVLTDYQNFQDSGTIPSTAEMTYIAQQDVDNTKSDQTPTLLVKLQQYAKACPTTTSEGN